MGRGVLGAGRDPSSQGQALQVLVRTWPGCQLLSWARAGVTLRPLCSSDRPPAVRAAVERPPGWPGWLAGGGGPPS